MLKLVIVLAAVVAMAASETRTIVSPTVVRVGQLVERVPTAVSHQSQTVVHKHADVNNDVLAQATVVRNVPVGRFYQDDGLTYYIRPNVDRNAISYTVHSTPSNSY